MSTTNNNMIGIRIRIENPDLQALFPTTAIASHLLARFIEAELRCAGETNPACTIQTPLTIADGACVVSDLARSMDVIRSALDKVYLVPMLAQICFYDDREQIWRAHGSGNQVEFRHEFNEHFGDYYSKVMLQQQQSFGEAWRKAFGQ